MGRPGTGISTNCSGSRRTAEQRSRSTIPVYYIIKTLGDSVAMMMPLTTSVAPTPPGAIFFGGGAWACAYSLGAAVHLRRKFRHLPDIPIGGVSSGAIVALAYILARSDEEMVSMFDAMSELARIYGTTGTMSLYIHLTLDRVLPIHGTDGTEYQRLNGGRFSVGITRFPCRPALICEWKSNQHVHDVIHTSVHVPIYCTYQPTFLAVDGGLSRAFWDISRSGNTIYISPLLQKAHIHPRKSISWSDIIWPSTVDRRHDLFEQGGRDAEEYLASPTRPRPARGAIRSLVLWLLRNIVSLGAWPVVAICRMLRWST
jgi:hypothetical protein